MNRNQVNKVWLSQTGIWIELTDGRTAQKLFSDFIRLKNADKNHRGNHHLSYLGIHSPDIDEDLSYESFFAKFDKQTEAREKARDYQQTSKKQIWELSQICFSVILNILVLSTSNYIFSYCAIYRAAV